MLRLSNGRPELFQWDTGQSVLVEEDCAQVHFAGQGDTAAVVVIPENGAAQIPDLLLQKAGPLEVYAYWGDQTQGYTLRTWRLQVKARQRPEDYVYTPQQTLTWTALEERVTALETGGVPQDTVAQAVEAYLADHPVEAGATEAQAAQIEANTQAIEDLQANQPQDGADGLTPCIGENGNWWIGGEDTGVSATGSGESAAYELKKSLTLDGDVSAVTLSADDAGDPLLLSEGFLLIDNPAAPGVSDCYMTVKGENGTAGQYTISRIANTVKTKAIIRFRQINGELFVETGAGTADHYHGSWMGWMQPFAIGNVTAITIRTSGQAYFMTGMTVTLYGKE